MLNDDLYLNWSLYPRNNTTRLSRGWMTRCIIMHDYLIFIWVLQAVSGRICHTLGCNKGHLWGLGARNPKKPLFGCFCLYVFVKMDSTSFMVLFLPPLLSTTFHRFSTYGQRLVFVLVLIAYYIHIFDKWFKFLDFGNIIVSQIQGKLWSGNNTSAYTVTLE